MEPTLDELRYSVDGEEACTLSELIEVNAEAFDRNDLIQILQLKVGENIGFGQGADVKRTA